MPEPLFIKFRNNTLNILSLVAGPLPPDLCRIGNKLLGVIILWSSAIFAKLFLDSLDECAGKFKVI